MIVVSSLLIVAIIFWVIVESINLFEEGIPAQDSDILEMLQNYETDFNIDRKWNDKFQLKASYRKLVPTIHQTHYSIIFPYYISGVGVVPIWYKSARKIKQMFDEKISTSKYTVTKRDRLVLK